MNIKKCSTCIICLIVVLVIVLFGAVSMRNNDGISGQWIGAVDGIDGKKLELIYVFEANGNVLTGIISSRLGGGPISDGKIEGNSIEFLIFTDENIIFNTGTLSGNKIHLIERFDAEPETIELVLKRKWW